MKEKHLKIIMEDYCRKCIPKHGFCNADGKDCDDYTIALQALKDEYAPPKLKTLTFDATITTRTTDQMHDIIDDTASEEGRSLGGMVRRLLTEALLARGKIGGY